MDDFALPVPEPPERPEPPPVAGEREALEGWLEFHRATLLRKCAGLTAAQLSMRACPPSTMSLQGLVRHMTDVERGWFQRRWVAGFQPMYWGPDNLDGDFDDLEPAHAATEVTAYLSALDSCRREAARHALDEIVPRHPEDPRATEVINLRWIYLHMIEEYARHNGHADLLRQAIDGTTGE